VCEAVVAFFFLIGNPALQCLCLFERERQEEGVRGSVGGDQWVSRSTSERDLGRIGALNTTTLGRFMAYGSHIADFTSYCAWVQLGFHPQRITASPQRLLIETLKTGLAFQGVSVNIIRPVVKL